MTGFGVSKGDEFTVEIKSVNHRYCDINVKMPRDLISIEDKIRNFVSEKVTRGKIDVFVTQNKNISEKDAVSIDYDAADSYYNALKILKERYNLKDDISLSLLAGHPDIFVPEKEEEDVEDIWKKLSDPLDQSLNMLISMREKEGKKLYNDICARSKYIKKQVDSIKEKSFLVVDDYREKLNTRLKDVLGTNQVDENRLAQEVTIFADKCNIDEEIVRLYSHLNQLDDTLLLSEPIGRKLDFIVQEMNRETNTIASKANNLFIVNCTLSIKNEIEKIREQIQNIE